MGNKIQKTHHTQPTRILALDVHPRSFGYVVVESPEKLLDWGVRRSYKKTKSHPGVLARGRLRPLLKIWKPGVVVTRVRDRRNKDVQSLLRHMKKEAGATSFLRITSTRDYYLGRGKHQRAAEMAARFPEVGWKLPPKRKLGDSEHYLISMFEALAIFCAIRGEFRSVELRGKENLKRLSGNRLCVHLHQIRSAACGLAGGSGPSARFSPI